MIPPLEFLRSATRSSLHASPSTRAVQAQAAGPGSPHPVEPTPVASSGPGPASPAEWLEAVFDTARAAGQTSYPRGTLMTTLALWTVAVAAVLSAAAVLGDRLLRAGDNALYEDES